MALEIAIGLVIIGACVLVAALIPAGRFMAIRTSEHSRYVWVALAALIFLFIFGFIFYTNIRWDGDRLVLDLGVPLVFFGTCLALAVSTLAFGSTQYLHRLAVLENENITDPLMGIANYRHFIATLNREVARSSRHQTPLALIMIDVDNFRKINDTYGYTVGDFVLIALAKVVLAAARDTDTTARYGKEELAVIAPNATAEQAACFAERIRRAVETAPLLPAEVSAGGDGAGVTVSVGVSSLGPHIRNSQALIVGATAALLKAKQDGRNRVAVR